MTSKFAPKGTFSWRQPDDGTKYISDGKQWILLPSTSVTTPVSGSSFQTFSSPAGINPFLKAFEAEWIVANPDGWWPDSYEEDRAHLELEAGHELMREWCEEVSK